jgi:hypothetical protein
MFIYNVTTSVNHDVHASWLQWMLDEHLPEVLGTGCFEKHQLVRLQDIDETEGPTYAVQYYAPSLLKYNQYQELYGNEFRKKITERWGNSITSFRTLMKVVDS